MMQYSYTRSLTYAKKKRIWLKVGLVCDVFDFNSLCFTGHCDRTNILYEQAGVWHCALIEGLLAHAEALNLFFLLPNRAQSWLTLSWPFPDSFRDCLNITEQEKGRLEPADLTRCLCSDLCTCSPKLPFFCHPVLSLFTPSITLLFY